MEASSQQDPSLQYLQIIMSRGTLRPQAVSEVADALSRLWPLLAPVHACVARYHPLLPVSQSCPLSEPPVRLLPHWQKILLFLNSFPADFVRARAGARERTRPRLQLLRLDQTAVEQQSCKTELFLCLLFNPISN